MGESEEIGVMFENSAPILRVEDMKASLQFYVDKLGFRNANWGSEDFHLCLTGPGGPLSLPGRPGARRRVGLDWSRRRREIAPGIRRPWREDTHAADEPRLGS